MRTAIMSEKVKTTFFDDLVEGLAPVLGCKMSKVNDADVFVSKAPPYRDAVVLYASAFRS